MVFCKECNQKVEDCPHCVFPLQVPRVHVFDPKIDTLGYDEKQRILEITFKTGQVWQLFGVTPNIYSELRDTSIWSFLRFMAQRYKSAPVKTGMNAVQVPESESCPGCQRPMVASNKAVNTVAGFVRVFWRCPECNETQVQTYGNAGTPKSNRKGSRWR